MTDEPCPACGRDQPRELGIKNGFRVLRCAGCRTLYAQSGPQTAENYDDYYHADNLSVPAFVSELACAALQPFGRYRRTNRLLDVGCGAGSMLRAARRLGWQAEGLEVAAPAVAHLRDQGFTVHHHPVEELREPDGAYDVVLACEVLEHLADPAGFLRAVRRLVRPGGLLYLTTPHGGGVSARALGVRWSVVSPPEHLRLYSVAGLRGLLLRGGFAPARIQATGANPFEIIQVLRGRAELRGPERVKSSYALNAYLSGKRHTRLLKHLINGGLALTRLGDGLKVCAEPLA